MGVVRTFLLSCIQHGRQLSRKKDGRAPTWADAGLQTACDFARTPAGHCILPFSRTSHRGFTRGEGPGYSNRRSSCGPARLYCKGFGCYRMSCSVYRGRYSVAQPPGPEQRSLRRCARRYRHRVSTVGRARLLGDDNRQLHDNRHQYLSSFRRFTTCLHTHTRGVRRHRSRRARCIVESGRGK